MDNHNKIRKLIQQYSEKFGFPKPVNGVFPFGFSYGYGGYSENEQINILERCLQENKPWYEYSEIINQLEKWSSEEKTLLEKGVLF